ncbi:hypothetical protein C8J56DRAFT_357884 [Mycena floridula]|nr:hypothetical protein C8J56DRAFT_357884 [Mycena floridula]
MASRNKRARNAPSEHFIPVPDLNLFNIIMDTHKKIKDEELAEAKRGDLESMHKLNERLFNHDDEEIWASYWPILLSHISSASRLLASSSPDSPFLYHCFFGLMCGFLSEPEAPTNRFQLNRALRVLEKSWSDVWDCTVFLMKHYGPSNPFSPPGSKIPIHEIITSFLSQIIRKLDSTNKGQQVTSSAGYLDIAIQLWLRSIVDIDIALEPPAVTYCMVLSISKDCMKLNQGLSDSVAESIAQIEGGSVALLRAILHPFKSRNVGELRAALRILCTCHCSPNIALQRDLMSKGAVVVVTRALTKLAGPIVFDRELFNLGIVFVKNFFRPPYESSQSPFDNSGVSNDKPWMIQALEGRILCSVVEASHMTFCQCGTSGTGNNDANSRSFASPIVSLLDRIAYFSTDERILRAIRKELRRVDSKSSNTMYAAKNGKPCLVWDAWVKFENKVRPMVEVRKVFYLEPQQICSYSKCPGPKITVKSAKRCGGCYLTYYCSQSCQNNDWKSAHKELCCQNPLRWNTTPEDDSRRGL